MSTIEMRNMAKMEAIHREERFVGVPTDDEGNYLKISDYYGHNVFHYKDSNDISEEVKKALDDVSTSGKKLSKAHAEAVAAAVTRWSIDNGATHFCHWFQPLTGATAEKHDSFLDIKNGKPIERLSATQLMQGEPDASSFPNGGSRSTFEARGYTTWDITSPLFLMEGGNGKTLCIPTAFVSYLGEALDIKTPLLRSISKLNEAATSFMNLVGDKDVKKVTPSCGAEQEYFLIDKAFYFSRPDLVMTGRTLFGSLTSRNQQLDDHYFGAIPERVISFMMELDFELHKLGIPAKTRHNEVAPGQFELAPIFSDANIAADNNQQIMALIKLVSNKHNFVALLHEKPFAGVNGSGKHVNWSMSSDTGINLLEPGASPHHNLRFLAVTAIVVEAVRRHSKMLRMSIASHSNDHRLGANEAPPSIISVFLGDTLEKIFESIKNGTSYTDDTEKTLDLGADQLANLFRDNTDRNRTSPFAFTGNRFEFRAVGSSRAIGLPLSVLNSAVASVFNEANAFLKDNVKTDKDISGALLTLIKKYINDSWQVVFNGDGYSDEWLIEAEKRGLPNLKTTADALPILLDDKETEFMTELGIFRKEELLTRYNVLVERYNALRKIEFSSLECLINQNILPATIEYKEKLGTVIRNQKDLGLHCDVEEDIYKHLNKFSQTLYTNMNNLKALLDDLPEDEQAASEQIAKTLFPLSEVIAESCNHLEEIVPTNVWGLPSYYDMLFLR